MGEEGHVLIETNMSHTIRSHLRETWLVHGRTSMAKTAMRPPVREAIVDAAIDALARNPGASLSAIAERAGVGRATLHRHFSSRADLLTAITRQCMDEVDAVVDEALGDARSARDRLSRMLEALIPLGDRYHFLASERSDDAGLEARHEASLEWLGSLVDELREEGAIATDVPRSWVVASIDAQVWLAWSQVAAGNLARSDAAGLALRTLLRGMSR